MRIFVFFRVVPKMFFFLQCREFSCHYKMKTYKNTKYNPTMQKQQNIYESQLYAVHILQMERTKKKQLMKSHFLIRLSPVKGTNRIFYHIFLLSQKPVLTKSHKIVMSAINIFLAVGRQGHRQFGTFIVAKLRLTKQHI